VGGGGGTGCETSWAGEGRGGRAVDACLGEGEGGGDEMRGCEGLAGGGECLVADDTGVEGDEEEAWDWLAKLERSRLLRDFFMIDVIPSSPSCYTYMLIHVYIYVYLDIHTCTSSACHTHTSHLRAINWPHQLAPPPPLGQIEAPTPNTSKSFSSPYKLIFGSIKTVPVSILFLNP